MSDTPFAPFQLTPPNPTASTEASVEPTKRRKKAESPHAAILDAALEKEPRQKRKKANGDKPGLKFDLQTILAAASELNADDYPLFEKLINLLDEAGKPGRERLLAAIQKVFA